MPKGFIRRTNDLPVAIIGAGPVGMAAAAHLVLRGLTPLVLEAGGDVGHAVEQWQHVRMFSPWAYNIDSASHTLLTAAGWSAPSSVHHPTGEELTRDYLKPLSHVAPLRNQVHYDARVTGVSRYNYDRSRPGPRADAPYILQIASRSGAVRAAKASAVIDCSGTWSRPNPAGAHGLPALGEYRCGNRISYGMPDVSGRDRRQYAGKVTLVVGSGHSAMNAVLGILEVAKQAPNTRIIWAIRRSIDDIQFSSGASDTLEQRRALGQRAYALLSSEFVDVLAPFSIDGIGQPVGAGLCVTGRHRDRSVGIHADRMVVATGFRPDFSFVQELRLAMDPVLEAPANLAPAIDPLLHSCCSVPAHGEAVLRHPEEGFYVAGMKSYGRTPNFLLSMGYEQVRSIAAALAGDHAAAQQQMLSSATSAGCSCNPLDPNAPSRSHCGSGAGDLCSPKASAQQFGAQVANACCG
jgi:hypothetical protein